MLDVFVVAKVYFLRHKETFLHTDAEVSDSLHLLALRPVAYRELRDPDGVDESLLVLNDVVEYEVQEDEQLDPHQFVVLAIGKEELYLRVGSVKDIYVLFGVDR